MVQSTSPANAATPAGAAGPRDHAMRMALAGEFHARPYPEIAAPARASHLALLSGETAAESEREHVARLCERHGVAPPAPGVVYFNHDFGGFHLRWERHTEFSTYGFLVAGRFDDPFTAPPATRVPADWLDTLPGDRLVACHLALLGRDDATPDDEVLAAWYAGNPVSGGAMVGGSALAWTDFHVHGDGFGRILIHDRDLVEGQSGRLVQRLLEIETYRMMALLALPLARELGPQVSTIETAVTEAMGRVGRVAGFDEESVLLDELSALAARLTQVVAADSYRFSAARAYHALVDQRLAELREERIEGRQPWSEFLERRLTPAMRTCESLARRQDSLSARVAHATDLLRTRVNLTLERQNRDLLASMNRRAKLQVRLQQMVEGLSVVAVSYYLLGLIAYAIHAVAGAGIALDANLILGLAVLPVIVLVWLAIRRIKRIALGK